MNLFLRKSWRLAGLVFPISYLFLNKHQELIFLGSILCIELIVEFSRFLNPSLNRFFLNIFKHIIKEKEKKSISSTGVMLSVIFLCFLLFKKEIAIIAVSFSIVGDAFSALIGKRWGVFKIKSKSLEGSLGFFLSSLIIGFMLNVFLVLPISLIIWAALIATLVEFFTPTFLNDNITVPFLTALSLRFMT